MSTYAIRYIFTAAGQASVVAAFRSVESAAQSAGRASAAAGVGGAAAPGARQARPRITAEERLAREAKRTQQRIERDQGRELTASRRFEEKKELLRRRSRMREDANTRQELLGMQKRASAMERYLNREQAAQRRVETAAQRRAMRPGRVGAAGRGALWLGGKMFTAGVLGVGALGYGAARVGGRALREGLELRDIATDIAVRGSRLGMGRPTGAGLARGFEATAMAVPGTKAADIAESVGAFIQKTGKGKEAIALQRVFAKIAMATGTKGADVGSTAADISEKFGITSPEAMMGALSTLAVQGKAGAFEMRDLAAQMPKMAAAGRVFGLEKGVRGVATLGGLAQIARRSVGTGPQAATAVESLLKQLQAKSGLIERKTGVQVFKDVGRTQAKDIRQLLPAIIAGTGGDKQVIAKLFEKKAFAAIADLVTTFNEARNSGKSLKEAQDAVSRSMEDAMNVQRSELEIEQDLQMQQQKTSAVATSMWESFKATLTQGLEVPVKSLVDKLLALENESGLVTAAAEALVVGFTALMEAAELAAEALVWLGFKKKRGPIEEAQWQQKKIDTKLAKLDLETKVFEREAARRGAPMTPEEEKKMAGFAERRKALVAQREAWEGTKFTTERTAPRSREETIRELVGLGKTREWAEEAVQKVEENPEASFETPWWAPTGFTAFKTKNPKALEVLQNWATQQVADRAFTNAPELMSPEGREKYAHAAMPPSIFQTGWRKKGDLAVEGNKEAAEGVKALGEAAEKAAGIITTMAAGMPASPGGGAKPTATVYGGITAPVFLLPF